MSISRAAIFGQLMICVTISSAAEPAFRTNICELAANPEHFLGKPLTFRADVESDGIHLALLSDETCRHGLRFGLKNAHPALSAKLIMNVAWGDDAGTANKKVKAEFTATLKATIEPTMYPKAIPFYLDVTEIRDLKIIEAEDR